ERLSTLLGAAPLTTTITPLGANVSGVRLVSEVALREYGALKLKNRRLVDAIFDSKTVAGFLAGTPGLKEWSLLVKAWYHATDQVVRAGVRRAVREKVQEQSWARWAELCVPLRTLEQRLSGAATPAAIARLAGDFERSSSH